ELIALAKDMKKAGERGESLGLKEDEIAFYDALEVNNNAVQVLGEPTLKTIARELVKAVKGNVTIDWTVRENVRANLRVIVKRILRKYGYPPDKQEKATQTVLEQAEVLSEGWAGAGLSSARPRRYSNSADDAYINRPRRQHYVPQFLLRRFSIPGTSQVHVYDKERQ